MSVEQLREADLCLSSAGGVFWVCALVFHEAPLVWTAVVVLGAGVVVRGLADRRVVQSEVRRHRA